MSYVDASLPLGVDVGAGRVEPPRGSAAGCRHARGDERNARTARAEGVKRTLATADQLALLVRCGFRVVGYERAGDEYVAVIEWAGVI